MIVSSFRTLALSSQKVYLCMFVGTCRCRHDGIDQFDEPVGASSILAQINSNSNFNSDNIPSITNGKPSNYLGRLFFFLILLSIFFLLTHSKLTEPDSEILLQLTVVLQTVSIRNLQDSHRPYVTE